MTKNEREIPADIVDDIENSDDKIWPLERLFTEVKRMIITSQMKRIERLTALLRRKTWWRKDFRRVYITEREAANGRCLLCHAGVQNEKGGKIPRCGYGNDCPCKYNQRLILKGEHWV